MPIIDKESSSLSAHVGRLASSMAADLVRIQLPMFLVTTLCFAQDYVLSVGLGLPRSLGRFLVWNALYTFGFQYIIRRRCRSLPEAAYVFAANGAQFAACTFLQEALASLPLLWLFQLIFSPFMTLVEYIHFKLFDGEHTEDHTRHKPPIGEGSGAPPPFALRQKGTTADVPKEVYLVKWSGKPEDGLLAFIASAFIVAGAALYEDVSDTTYYGEQLRRQMLLFVPLTIVSDFLFSVAHNLAHRLPSLWRRHKVHHEYRRNELCTIANFYSDFVDGLLMAFPILFASCVSYSWGLPVWTVQDFISMGGFTHHKYGHQYITFLNAYEVDILIDVVAGKKMAAFHNAHHQDPSERYAAFGLVSDGTARSAADLIMRFFPFVNKNERPEQN